MTMGSEAGKRGPKRKRDTMSYVFDGTEGTDWLLSLVIGAALSGDAIRVGLTRDGGSVAIGIYHGDEYGTEYVRPDEPLENAVREISLVWGIPMAYYDDVAGRWLLRP